MSKMKLRDVARVGSLMAVSAAVPLTVQIVDTKTASQDAVVAQLKKEMR
jgi:hypothetical protein